MGLFSKLSHSGVPILTIELVCDKALSRLIGVRGGWPGNATTGSELGGENNPLEVNGFCPSGGDWKSTGPRGSTTPAVERGSGTGLGLSILLT